MLFSLILLSILVPTIVYFWFRLTAVADYRTRLLNHAYDITINSQEYDKFHAFMDAYEKMDLKYSFERMVWGFWVWPVKIFTKTMDEYGK